MKEEERKAVMRSSIVAMVTETSVQSELRAAQL